MRNIFLALVLANFAFAAWHAWFSGGPAGRFVDPSVDETVSESASIQLVGEVDADPRSSPEPGRTPAADFPDPRSTSEPSRTPAADFPRMDVSPAITMPALEPASPSSQAGNAAEAAPDDSVSAGNPPDGDAQPAVRADESPAARADPPPAAGADVQANQRRCVSVGPFQDAAAVTAAMETLRTAGHLPSPRDTEGPAVIDYWVHLAEIPSRAEANEILARLHENGVDEAYLIPGEEDGDVISLGVFRQTSRAGRLQDEVRQVGYESIVAELTRRPTIRWIDIALEPGRSLDAANLQTPGRITRLEQQPCPASEG